MKNQCRFGFVLIDLLSQREAAMEYVCGWSAKDILCWMRQYGSVEKVEFPGRDIFIFYSNVDKRGYPFYFTESGELFIFIPLDL